jgi:hypothetical protein
MCNNTKDEKVTVPTTLNSYYFIKDKTMRTLHVS